jgi:hypothetical protein
MRGSKFNAGAEPSEGHVGTTKYSRLHEPVFGQRDLSSLAARLQSAMPEATILTLILKGETSCQPIFC